MSRRTRRVVALVALCVAASMALGVGSYSSVSAERSVSVVPSEEAYLAFAEEGELQCGADDESGDNDEFIKNQFAGDTVIKSVEVRVTAVGGYVKISGGGSSATLWDGDSRVLRFDETYGPGESAEIQLEPAAPESNITGADHLQVELVKATGSNVRVSETSLTYDIHCPDRGGGDVD